MDPIRQIIEAFDVEDVFITDEGGNRIHYKVNRITGKLVKEKALIGNDTAGVTISADTIALWQAGKK